MWISLVLLLYKIKLSLWAPSFCSLKKILLHSLVIHYIFVIHDFISQDLHFLIFTSCFWCITYLQQVHLYLLKFYPSFRFHFKSYLAGLKSFLVLSFDPVPPPLPHQDRQNNWRWRHLLLNFHSILAFSLLRQLTLHTASNKFFCTYLHSLESEL